MKRLITTLLLLLAMAAQAQEGQLYTPGPFERLDISGGFTKITLRQGDKDQVFIHGGHEVQKKIRVELSRGTLEIHSTENWKFWNRGSLSIEVMVRQLSRLSLSGASDVSVPEAFKADKLNVDISGAGMVRMDALTAEHLRFSVSGAGDAQLSGQVGSLNFDVSGKGKLMAENLKAERGHVSISGIGGANIWVTDDLRVSVSGVGSVDYWGEPRVRKSTSGIGSVNGRGAKKVKD